MYKTCREVRSLLSSKPRERLGFFPTPMYKLERLSEELDINLFIKRDDFTGMNLFGGNKIRKLEYILGDAVSQNCEYVFTYGATQSNHAMQTVSACCRCGLKPVLYLSAIVPPDDNDLRSNLLLDRIMGAEVNIVNVKENETAEQALADIAAAGKDRIHRLEENGHKCYDIPVGGATYIGSAGFIEGFVELQEQLYESGVEADYLFHATGSGGTMAGLAAGKKILASKIKIISVAVMDTPEDYAEKNAVLGNKSLKWIGSDEVISPDQDMHIDKDYFFPGYEMPGELSTEAIKMMAVKEGILLDPVYSGKGFAALVDYAANGKIKAGSNVVFWHTGGATALFAEKEILGKLY